MSMAPFSKCKSLHVSKLIFFEYQIFLVTGIFGERNIAFACFQRRLHREIICPFKDTDISNEKKYFLHISKCIFLECQLVHVGRRIRWCEKCFLHLSKCIFLECQFVHVGTWIFKEIIAVNCHYYKLFCGSYKMAKILDFFTPCFCESKLLVDKN